MSGRAEDGANKPAFFTLMVFDFINSVSIPKAFVKYIYNRNVPRILLLKQETGKAALVEIEKRDGGWFFGKGWAKFVKEQRLEYGDFLHFTMIDESTFEVAALDMTCCSKNLRHYVGEQEEERVMEMGESSRAAAQRTRGFGMPEIEPPSFNVTLPKNDHIYELCVPKKFAEATALRERDMVVLKDRKGYKWDVKLRLEKLPHGERMRFSSGWIEFYRDMMLKPDDKIFFQIIPGTWNEISVQILSRA